MKRLKRMLHFPDRVLPALLFLGAAAAPGFYRPARAAIAPIETQTLKNGVTFVMRTDRLAPRVAISVLAPAGMADETAATAGWRRLLTETMLRATQSDTTQSDTAQSDANADGVLLARDITRAAEKLGGELGASVADDAIEFHISGDSDKAAALLDLLLRVVRHPRLADEDVAAARRRLQNTGNTAAGDAAAGGAEPGNAVASALASLRAELYRGENRQPLAYGLPDDGTPETREKISAAQLREYHANFFEPDCLIVSAAGDVNAAALRARLQQIATSTSPRPQAASTPAFAPLDAARPPLQIKQMDVPGAYVLIGYTFPGVNVTHPDWAPLQILSAALGQSARARLPQRLLTSSPVPALPAAGEEAPQEATASEVSTQLTPRRYASELILAAQTGAQSVNAAKDAILDEVRRLREAPLSTTELNAARHYARGDWAVTRQTPHDRAFLAAMPVLSGATNPQQTDIALPARLETVTAEDVQRVARHYLQNYAVALIMPKY